MLKFNSKVRQALEEKQPVLALESTLIAHGLAWPGNMETALAVEQCVRDNGAIPATIGIVKGQLIVGLEEGEIEHIARNGASASKCSPRDFAAVISRKGDGATTVAGTLYAAVMAGIEVMATGGIGGVHRQAALSFDVSADLQVLAGSPVMLVSSGAKSILDLSATLEMLETLGVPVVGYECKEFPAFYTRKSGLALELHSREIAELVGMHKIRRSMNMPQGMLIANPVPESGMAEADRMEQFTNQAVSEAEKAGIIGKALTPFLLSRIVKLSEGESLKANISLIVNNARLGAQIARELSLSH